MQKFREGDRVTIEATIATNYVLDDGKIKIRIEPYHDIFVNQNDLTMSRPDFRVGDRVTWSVGEQSFTGHVLSIHDDHLWIDLGNVDYATVWTGKAMRLDPEPEETAEAA